MNEPTPQPPRPRSPRAPYKVSRGQPRSGGADEDAAVARAGDLDAGLVPAARAACEEEVLASAAALRAVRPFAPRLLNVGYGNQVAAARVVAIVAPAASPMRRLRREAAERGKLVDATEGRRTRAILIMDSDHVVLSAILPETLSARLADGGADG